MFRYKDKHDILALVPMTEKVTSQLIDFDRKIITSLHLPSFYLRRAAKTFTDEPFNYPRQIVKQGRK